MINPNAKHTRRGVVTKLSRSQYEKSLNLEVTLADGSVLNELGFIYHDSLKVGDKVRVQIGFRITSDRHGIESVRKYSIG